MLRDAPRRTIGAAAALFALAAVDCGQEAASPDGSAEATIEPIDLCDAFSGVDTACPIESPTRCFPLCAEGGCFCRATPQGPRWNCVTDRSCQPECSPLDDVCASDAAAEASE